MGVDQTAATIIGSDGAITRGWSRNHQWHLIRPHHWLWLGVPAARHRSFLANLPSAIAWVSATARLAKDRPSALIPVLIFPWLAPTKVSCVDQIVRMVPEELMKAR